MRLAVLCLLGAVLAGPVLAQQISPMTGTTAAPPQVAPGPSGAAPAAPAPARARRQTMQQRFEAANTTKDGKLTLQQAEAGKITRVVRNFDAIDTGKKGYVTMEDIQAFNRAQRAAHKAAR